MLNFPLKTTPYYNSTTNAVSPPIEGSTASKLSFLTSEVIQEFQRKGKHSISELLKTRELDEGVAASIALMQLRVMARLGNYTHPIPEIKKWVRGNFADMEGTLAETVHHLALAPWIGSTDAEINPVATVRQGKKEWRLKGLQPISPDKVKYAGSRRLGLTHVIDMSHPNPSNRCNWIPVSKVLHVDLGSFDGSPYGYALARNIMPYVKAKQVLMTEWIVAGRNQSSGLLIGKADSNQSVSLLDRSGQPLRNPDGTPRIESAVEQLTKQLEKLDSTNFLVTDPQNNVMWQPMSVDSGFFQQAIQYVDGAILLGLGIPKLTFNEGSGQFGNTSVAMVQKTMLDTRLGIIADKIEDQIIERVIRPLLVFNFGLTAEDGWGNFEADVSSDPIMAQSQLQMLMQAVAMQVIPATDPTVMDSIRQLLKLPSVSEEDALGNIRRAADIQALQQSTVMKAQMEVQNKAQLEMMEKQSQMQQEQQAQGQQQPQAQQPQQ